VNSLIAVLLGREKKKQESIKEEKTSSMGKHTNAGERARTIIAGSRQGTSGMRRAVSPTHALHNLGGVSVGKGKAVRERKTEDRNTM